MIRVTVELIPGGYEKHPRRRVLGTAEIANVGGTESLGDYRYELRGKSGHRMSAGAGASSPGTCCLACCGTPGAARAVV